MTRVNYILWVANVFVTASGWVCSIKPNAFWKLYIVHMTRFVNIESSNACISICNWCDVHLSTLNPSWLLYNI